MRTLSVAVRLFVTVLLAIPTAASQTWSGQQLVEINAIERKVVSGNGYFSIRTPHFQVRTEIDARFTAELARYMELFHDEATKLLMLSDVVAQTPAQITVFASQSRYQASLGKGTRSRGQFDWLYPNDTGTAIYTLRTYAANDRERTFGGFCRAIINHEATHYLLQLRAGRNRIPNLVHEGVATYLQSWDFFKSREWNLAHHSCEFAPNLKHAIEVHDVPSISWLSEVATWDVDDFGPLTNTRYACAENFIAYLLCDDSRKGFFKQLMSAATGGEKVQRLFTAGPGADLEAQWRRCLFGTTDPRG
ncbi:MAG: hypothetical protein H0V44_17515 [Planctomycetes bacterium]|nr:hypothetical protein [Planctomycetota bacterium]